MKKKNADRLIERYFIAVERHLFKGTGDPDAYEAIDKELDKAGSKLFKKLTSKRGK